MCQVAGLPLTGSHDHGCSIILADELAVQACLQEDPGVPQLVIMRGMNGEWLRFLRPVSEMDSGGFAFP
jgi:hypothetical protein